MPFAVQTGNKLVSMNRQIRWSTGLINLSFVSVHTHTKVIKVYVNILCCMHTYVYFSIPVMFLEFCENNQFSLNGSNISSVCQPDHIRKAGGLAKQHTGTILCHDNKLTSGMRLLMFW